MFLRKCHRLRQSTLVLVMSIGVLLGTNFLLRQRLLHWLIEQIPSVMAAPAEAPSLQGSVVGVPQLFNYQGNLRDPQGNPLSGSYNMTFRIYESVSVATALWTEQINGVTVRNGAFNALLGATTPLPVTLFNGPDRFIGVTVAPYAEMVPRQRLASVPFAMRANEATTATQATNAANADRLDTLDSTDFARTIHQHDDRYYTESELGTSGAANVHWSNLRNLPAGFADGIDNGGLTGNLVIETGTSPQWYGQCPVMAYGLSYQSGNSAVQARICIGDTCSSWTTLLCTTPFPSSGGG